MARQERGRERGDKFWPTSSTMEPTSIKTGKPFAGGVGENLTKIASEHGYTSNLWGGPKQWKAAGRVVRPGEKVHRPTYEKHGREVFLLSFNHDQTDPE